MHKVNFWNTELLDLDKVPIYSIEYDTDTVAGAFNEAELIAKHDNKNLKHNSVLRVNFLTCEGEIRLIND